MNKIKYLMLLFVMLLTSCGSTDYRTIYKAADTTTVDMLTQGFVILGEVEINLSKYKLKGRPLNHALLLEEARILYPRVYDVVNIEIIQRDGNVRIMRGVAIRLGR